jgi:hypothetical protein
VSLTNQFTPSKSDTKPLIIGILFFWFVLAIPWLPVALLSPMVFEGGYTWKAYLFVWSMWLYPITTSVAFLCRRRDPLLVLLPILNIVGTLLMEKT